MSPITPPLRPTRVDEGPTPRQTYTHSQPDQTGMLPPPPEPIDFESNPDVIALRSAISVLQVQRKRAAEDIQTLSKAMDQAVEEPEAFVKDLVAGRTQGQPSQAEGCDDGKGPSQKKPQSQTKAWSSLPKPQDVVRSPPINWAQYAVVGDSLEKLHAEQVAQPTQGSPATVGANGMFEFKAGDGKQEKYAGVAAQYMPGKDKIDRKPSRGKK